MGRTLLRGFLTASLAVAIAPWLSACIGPRSVGLPGTAALTGNATERECLVRAMYFESNRSSHDGLMAVGTVVMNRVKSPRYPNTICGVVSQPRQFAHGVMTRPLDPRQLPAAERAADAILKGERYAPIGDAMHFHVAGLRIPYRVQYVAQAGGNAFYLKKGRRFREPVIASKKPEIVTASAVSAAPASESASAPDAEATMASSEGEDGILQRLYSRVASPMPPAGSCETVAAGFGATSLACETDIEGR